MYKVEYYLTQMEREIQPDRNFKGPHLPIPPLIVMIMFFLSSLKTIKQRGHFTEVTLMQQRLTEANQIKVCMCLKVTELNPMGNHLKTNNQQSFKLQSINNLLALPLAFLYKNVSQDSVGKACLTNSGLILPSSNRFLLKCLEFQYVSAYLFKACVSI